MAGSLQQCAGGGEPSYMDFDMSTDFPRLHEQEWRRPYPNSVENPPRRQHVQPDTEAGRILLNEEDHNGVEGPTYDESRARSSSAMHPPHDRLSSQNLGEGPSNKPHDRVSREKKPGFLRNAASGFVNPSRMLDRSFGREPSQEQSSYDGRYGDSGGGRHAHRGGPVPPPKEPNRRVTTREELEATQKENLGLLERIEGLKDKCQQLKRRNDLMQSACDEREGLLSRQEVDSVIQTQFRDIFVQIKAWTNTFCRDPSQPLDISHVSSDQLPLVSRVVPSIKTLDELPGKLPPGDARQRRKFIRGWIALRVAETMFRSLPAPRHSIAAGSDIWIPSVPGDGGPREAVAVLELTLLQSGDAITKGAFHEWRALTFSLLSKMYPTPRWPPETIPYITDTVHSTMDLVKSLGRRDANLADNEQKLMDNVFIPAAKLSQILRRQRACWYVRFPQIMTAPSLEQNDYVKKCVFNREFMKDSDNYGNDDDDDVGQNSCLKEVEIIITPGLFKTGNHNGEQYDTECVVEKAEVSFCDNRGSAPESST